MISGFVFKQTIQHHSNPNLYPNNWCQAEVDKFCEDLQHLLELTLKKGVLFIIRDWNAKVGSQEIPRIIGKFGFVVQNEAKQRLTEYWQENTLVTASIFFQQPKSWLYLWKSLDSQTKIRLIMFFTAKDGEGLYSQQEQYLELTVAQNMSSI